MKCIERIATRRAFSHRTFLGLGRKKLKPVRLFAVLTLLAGLVACAGPKWVDPKDETLSLVYGYFDMKDAPSSLDWVSVKKYDSTSKKGQWYHLAADEGVFMHVGMEPGSYQVDQFGGMGGIPLLTRREFQYDYGSKGRNDTAVRIRTAGTVFLGSFRYIDHSGGIFRADKFELKPSDTPTEKEVLEKVVKKMETEKKLKPYTRQLAMARQRLSQLK